MSRPCHDQSLDVAPPARGRPADAMSSDHQRHGRIQRLHGIRWPQSAHPASKAVDTDEPDEGSGQLNHPFRRFAAVFGRVALAGAVAAAACSLWLAAAGLTPIPFVGLILSLSAILTGVLGALSSLYQARRADGQLDAFRYGDYLACWHYDRTEWVRFAEAEWRRAQQEENPAIAFAVLGALGAVLGLFWPGSLGPRLVAMAVGGSALGLFGVGMAWIRLAVRRARYRRALQSRTCAYIGRTSLACNGEFWTWQTFGTRLAGVRLVEDDPAYLEFLIEIPTGRGTHTEPTRIPVPAGREGEAGRVVELLGGSRSE